MEHNGYEQTAKLKESQNEALEKMRRDQENKRREALGIAPMPEAKKDKKK